MARFSYALQCALEHRKAAERQAGHAYAVACAVSTRMTHACNALDAAIASARHGLRRCEATAAGAFAEVDLRLERLRRARGSLADRLEQARATAEQARATYARAVRDRSALERHRARKYESFLASQTLREASELDAHNALRRALSTPWTDDVANHETSRPAAAGRCDRFRR